MLIQYFNIVLSLNTWTSSSILRISPRSLEFGAEVGRGVRLWRDRVRLKWGFGVSSLSWIIRRACRLALRARCRTLSLKGGQTVHSSLLQIFPITTFHSWSASLLPFVLWSLWWKLQCRTYSAFRSWSSFDCPVVSYLSEQSNAWRSRKSPDMRLHRWLEGWSKHASCKILEEWIFQLLLVWYSSRSSSECAIINKNNDIRMIIEIRAINLTIIRK